MAAFQWTTRPWASSGTCDAQWRRREDGLWVRGGVARLRGPGEPKAVECQAQQDAGQADA